MPACRACARQPCRPHSAEHRRQHADADVTGSGTSALSEQLLNPALRSCCAVQVNFGELFFGESSRRHLTLVNNGPTEACFDLSFGSVADLKALLATGPDEEASTGDDSQLAAFLQVARIRVSGTVLSPAILCSCSAAVWVLVERTLFVWMPCLKLNGAVCGTCVVCYDLQTGKVTRGQGYNAEGVAHLRCHRTLQQRTAAADVQALLA